MFYAAELNENKNQIFLINMINELKMEIPDIKLLLAGIGPLEKEYKNAVKELNLEKYVDFLGYRDDIDKLLQICDVVVPSSLREGLPINLLEAMACGKPIVASDNRGHRELVKDGVNGYLYQPSDKSKAVNSIIKLYKSPELCKKMGQAGADMAKQYDVEIVMKEMGKIYAKYI